jgi:hypothetical protein
MVTDGANAPHSVGVPVEENVKVLLPKQLKLPDRT